MRSFAVSEGRDIKAAKIESVLCASLKTKVIFGLSILDIGAGSGHIAVHFAKDNSVVAADVENQLGANEGLLTFVQITGPVLPFESGSFDVVILNHVITYIPDQLSALLEIRRVLKPGGICYIALPNKLFPRDPHSKFLFVHYLPRALYQNFLNWLTGAKEDVIMHTPKGMTKLFKEANFSWEDYTVDILHDPDGFHSGTRLKFPSWRWLTIISPSNVFVLKAEM